MNTSILTVVAAALLLAGQNSAPRWQQSYSQAQQQGAQQKKPLAVVFGMGANGWSKVVRDGAPGADANQVLSEKYVCVYVDMATKAGRDLAKNFEITGDVGIVISDRTGDLQAFWYSGDMTSQVFVSTLQKYSDTQRVVTTTETGSIVRTSYYPQLSTGSGATFTLPGDSSYCPTCNNGGGGRMRR